ncbi:MAG: hypothetical protein P1U41_07800 [Vicingaceae bacterium]|nr:hypothetical protein [Vicingaceae bacterium]
MKKIALLFILPLFLVSCGGEETKEKELENIDVEKNPLGALMKMGKNMAENAEKMEEKMKNRKDAKAIHYEELLKYLPESIEGYQINGEPKGASMDMQGMSYSSAEIEFKNKDGNRIDITLLDYNAAYNMYTMATTMWASGFKIDTSEEFAQSISFGDNINGWESFKKKSYRANIALGIGDRFLLTIDGDNQEGTEALKEIIKSMDIDGLAGLE